MPSAKATSKQLRAAREEAKGKVSDVRQSVIAVLVSDIHLSHTPPVARSNDDDWYGTMEEYLKQLVAVKSKYSCPLICAGDIFEDGWRPSHCPAELINFAINHLPAMIAIPGQHDLPHHNYEDITKSAYWTLREAGVVTDLGCGDEFIKIPTPPIWEGALWAMPFPWGKPLHPVHESKDGDIQMAVVHDYIWANEHKYKGAPEEKRVKNRLGDMAGFDVLHFGDNHKGFISNQIVNCGTFLRRKMDERHYKPFVGLLHKDAGVSRYELDTQADTFIDVDEALEVVEHAIDAADLIEQLGQTGHKIADFAEAVVRFCERNKVAKGVRNFITQSLEEK